MSAATPPLHARFDLVRDQLLLRDAARLSRQIAGARNNPKFDAARFERDVEAALLAAENRARLRPATIRYPAELPVVQAKDELLKAIAEHQVVVLCGETGSGKTTQLPKLCLELGRGTRGLIGHTQPRRLAARSVANRIASELDTKVGELVGFETRFDRRMSERSLVKLMTDGILLAELSRDRELLAYDTIIIDEAHERSLNIDFLLGWLKRLLPKRPELKLIITSATLDPEKLARHFARPAQTSKVVIPAQGLGPRLRGDDGGGLAGSIGGTATAESAESAESAENVIPAKAGIQSSQAAVQELGPRLRGDDGDGPAGNAGSAATAKNVIPAKSLPPARTGAGIQSSQAAVQELGPRLRGDDDGGAAGSIGSAATAENAESAESAENVIPAKAGIQSLQAAVQELGPRLRGDDGGGGTRAQGGDDGGGGARAQGGDNGEALIPAPILLVEGRTYPVEMRYREPDQDDDLEAQVANGIESLWQSGRVGDTLVFLPGEREINDLARSLPGRFPRAEVLPLYSRLPAEKQDKVFSSGGAPRIVLATNVAETSVTVPGIRYVIDTGTARINRFSPRLGVQQLQIEAVSQAAANQRAGRCGRVGPGVCLRLYDQPNFDTRPPFTDPEILRSNLAGVILQMASLSLGDVEDFPWLDAPEGRHIADGYRLLQTLGALDETKRITPLGRELGRLPLDPRIARIAVAARGTAYREHVWVLAAALSVQDPHDVPPDQQNAARLKHAEWRHPKSDFITLLNLWARYQQWSASSNNRQLRKLCKEHFVSYLRLEEWESVHKQIVDMLGDREASGVRREASKQSTQPTRAPAGQAPTPHASPLTPDEALYAPIHKCLLAGLIDQIGQKDREKPDFNGPRGRRFKVFPGSTLAKKPPPWIMSAQLAQTSQLFGRVNAEIQPEWLAEVAPHLVKRVLQDPVWHSERGEVTAMEVVTLFGMQVLRRARHYGRDEPAKAREIFIREALVRGEMPNKPAFLDKNLALLDAVRDKEARLRRPDLLADDAQFFAFYDTRIPAEVCTTVGLKNWLRREPAAQRTLTMVEAQALKPGANADVATLFPDHLDLAGSRIELSYSHEPGADEDGVTFEIPIAQLFSLPATRFDWLVPGLLPARIEALIRSLPMHLRRLCTPAAEYATAIANAANPDSGALLDAICAKFRDMNGVQLKPDDFSTARLDAHLKPRLVLVGADGKAIGEAESLAALQQRHGGAARSELGKRAEASPEAKRWTRELVMDWDFGAMPEHILIGTAKAYPALVQHDSGAGVGLKLFESADAARAAHAIGTQALLLARVADRLKDLARTARAKLGISLAQTGLSAEQLALQVAERAARSYWNPAAIRDEQAFHAALAKRGEFGREAVKRLEEVCAWLTTGMELRKKLDATAKPWPDANSDLRQQLQTLFAPGFIAAIPDDIWPRIGVYLKAATVRADRLPHKPQRDLDMLAQLKPWLAKLPGPFHPARWVIEEWRIALFAQELKANGSPTATKVQAALAA